MGIQASVTDCIEIYSYSSVAYISIRYNHVCNEHHCTECHVNQVSLYICIFSTL